MSNFTFSTIKVKETLSNLQDMLAVGTRHEEIIGRIRAWGLRHIKYRDTKLLECKLCGQVGGEQATIKHQEGCPMADITEQHTS